MGTERIAEFLRFTQVTGHAAQVGRQVFKAGAAFNQLLRGGQGVVRVTLYGAPPGVQFLAAVRLSDQRLQFLLHVRNISQDFARFIEGFQLSGGDCAIKQARQA